MQEELLRFDRRTPFIWADVETQNLNLNRRFNLPFQISYIKTVAGVVKLERNMYIDWGDKYTVRPEIAKMNHYSREVIREKGMRPEEVAEQFQHDIEKQECYVCGHNLLGFDIYQINQFFKQAGSKFQIVDEETVKNVLDTYPLAKGMLLSLAKKKDQSLLAYQYSLLNMRVKTPVRLTLSSLAKYLHIEVDDALLHDALVDVKLNSAVWEKMKLQLEI